MPVVTADQLTHEIVRRSRLLDEAIDELKARSVEYAEAEHEYRKARASAYLATSGTIPEREARVIQSTSELRLKAQLSQVLRESAMEAIRARRAQLSAAQSVANASRAEAELGGRGPG